jgi:aminoacyl-tRNA hydrolase
MRFLNPESAGVAAKKTLRGAGVLSIPLVARFKAVRNDLRTFWRGLRWYARDRSPHIAALLVRRARPRCMFICITGSAGKTTTKDLSAAMLSRLAPCHKSPGSRGANEGVELTVRSTTRLHRFCVVEVGATEPGKLDRSVRTIRPHIAAITLIAREHYSAFGSLEAIAAEKAKVVRALGRNGTAVLNIDDPYCREIGKAHAGPVIWFGRDAAATLRLLECSSRWPDPLSVSIAYQGPEYTARTKLHGTHLVLPVLAAIGIAVAAGMPISKAIEVLSNIAPSEGRMQVVQTDDGVTWLRDDWKAAHWSMQPPIDFMREAPAQRKIIVIGTISDSPRSPSKRYTHAARDALKAADIVILVGPQCMQTEREKCEVPGKSLQIFATLREASLFLGSELRSGDLVLLKGTNKQDHMVRLLLNHCSPIQCWAPNCGRIAMCGDCSRLYAESASPNKIVASQMSESTDRSADAELAVRLPIVVGLGNPDASLQDSAHNIGYRLVEELAKSADASWTDAPEGAMCEVRVGTAPAILFKPRASMNRSGPQLYNFLARTKRSIGDCFIVYDDFDLPLGNVRARNRGGDGGHKGVQSIIAAFGTADFHRVRIGVRPEGEFRKAGDMVLSRFSEHHQQLVSAGLKRAMAAIQELIGAMPRVEQNRFPGNAHAYSTPASDAEV